MKGLGVLMRIVGSVVSPPAGFTAEGLPVSAGSTYLGDNSKARRELGFQPRPLEEGLRETLLHEMMLLKMLLPLTDQPGDGHDR
jgi:nucleoside-diphosphate-sugar epimerase